MNKFIGILIILFLFSCKKETEKKIDVSGIDVTVSIERFDQKFYETTVETLPEIKAAYPYLFPIQNPDSVWLNRINSEEEIILYKKAQAVFGDFEAEKSQIETLFKHIKYFHPTFKSPQVITLITNLDYKNKVLYAEDFLFISLDMYLGGNEEIYKDFPLYLARNFDKSQLMVDMGKAIGDSYFIPSTNRQFIDLMVNEGKKMYQLLEKTGKNWKI